MSLHHVFSDATASTIDITDRVRTPGPPATSYSVRDDAEEGSVAISEMTIDDPDGDIIITGLRRIYSYEDEAPAGDQLVHNGITFGEKVIRGPNRVGAGRQWLVTVLDPNTLLNRRVMNGDDANRPAENDLERIQALLTMTELNTVDDDSMVSLTAATVNMNAVDYRGQNVGQYIDDCRQASGKNAYVFYNETLGEYGLWYDFDYSSEFDSECFLTTDEAQEVDYDTVFGYSIERTWINFDPSRVVSGGYMTGPFGTLYDQNATTVSDFAAVDRAIPAENVKTLPMAQVRMDRYLEDGSTEEAIIHTVMTKVPRSKVNAIKKGYLVSFKAEWGPGFESYVQGRVLYRHVTEITEDPIAGYEIEMDISPFIGVACSYEWLGSETTEDALGGAMASGGYNAAASVYPSTDEIISGPGITYGTPNDGNAWGMPPGVIEGPAHFQVRWIWDLDSIGSPAICAVRLSTTAGGGFSSSQVQGSDDGVIWDTVLTVTDYLAAGASAAGFATAADAYVFPSNIEYRYWAFLYDLTQPSGGLQYFDGLDMRAVMLWAAP